MYTNLRESHFFMIESPTESFLRSSGAKKAHPACEHGTRVAAVCSHVYSQS